MSSYSHEHAEQDAAWALDDAENEKRKNLERENAERPQMELQKEILRKNAELDREHKERTALEQAEYEQSELDRAERERQRTLKNAAKELEIDARQQALDSEQQAYKEAYEAAEGVHRHDYPSDPRTDVAFTDHPLASRRFIIRRAKTNKQDKITACYELVQEYYVQGKKYKRLLEETASESKLYPKFKRYFKRVLNVIHGKKKLAEREYDKIIRRNGGGSNPKLFKLLVKINKMERKLIGF